MNKTDPNTDNFFIVGIGASAGGVQALESFFGNLPDDPNAVFVVVQHLSPNHKSMMTEILQRQTPMPVHEVQDQMTIQPSHVYIMPPGKNLVLENRKLHLQAKSETLNYPINQFFQSLAQQWGERTIAILLAGTGNDGNEGLQAISLVGGVALVQSPETAQFTSMPSSAIPSGLVDEILSPQELAQTVFQILRFSDNCPSAKLEEASLIDPNQLQQILDILAEREEIDFSHYKFSTLSRRINHRCALVGFRNLQDYIRFLNDATEEQKLLRQHLLIGATCFFRDAGAWEFLEYNVFPQLIQKLQPQQQLRIWVSACATGEEAYSMAILIDEAIKIANKPVQVKIFATDLDTNALEIAAQGIYPETIANDISPERLERYFNHNADHFQVKRSLREMVIIAPHDLTKNAGFSKMNLVSCRNVLIYMQPQLQQRVLRLLHFALAPQGILLLGSSETLGDLGDEFIPLESKWKIFCKRRDTQLSLMPITQQTVVTPIQSSSRSQARQHHLDRLLGEVLRYSLGERQMTCLLVNHNNQLLRVFYNAAQLLEFPVGEAVLDVTEIIHPSLKLPLSTALHRTKRDKQPVLYTGIRLNRNGREQNVSLQVGLDQSNPTLGDYLIVVLEVDTQPSTSIAAPSFEVNEEAAQQITELEYELQQTRENLQVTIEELETTNEEQQATNEELLASNEELQSTNEELQSVNEELYTVNGEYQSKIQELTQLNNDIDNLLRSTNIGVMFLDKHLRIRKFTPATTYAINIRGSDIGRPLADLTNHLDYPNLIEILQQVLQTQEEVEQEVRLTSSNEYLLMRINPYLREENQSDGVVVTLINISELKHAQNELEETNNNLENLYAVSPVGLCLFDENLRFLRINPSLAQMHGYSVQEHLGQTVREMIPDLADQIEPYLRQVIETHASVNEVEIRGTTALSPDQQRCWMASYYPVNFLTDGRGVGGVIVEVTGRMKIEEALRQNQATLLEAQRLAQLGNWELDIQQEGDPKTLQPEWSEALFHIYGFDPQRKFPGFEAWLECYPDPDRRMLQQAIDRLIEKGTAYNLDLRFIRPNGELRYLNMIGRAMCNEQGQVKKLYGAVVDVTDRKTIEAELVQQNQALEDAIAIAQAADSANRAKSEFLANVSHEIRTPMNTILGASQLLLRTELNDHQQNLLKRLKANGEKLLTLINDILDLSKLEAQKLRLDVRDFDLQTLTQAVKDTFASLAAAKGLGFRVDIQANIPRHLRGDDFRLQQVLNNLVGNAIKFTPSGSVSITISCHPNSASDPLNSSDPLESGKVTFEFQVQDTGIGINPEYQKKLFQPFTQGDGSTTRQYGGTGLGLTICRRIVQLMGGDIGVESRWGEGSTFWFRIPLELSDSDLSQKSPVPQPTGSTPTLSQDTGIALNLLIVEDNPDNRDLLLFMLEDLGHRVNCVNDGQQALNELAKQDYDVVLMDCQMPVIDGYEATNKLREREGNQRHTIVIGLTANAMQGDRDQCLAAGMDDYISKPVFSDDLAKLLAKWCNSSNLD